MQCEKTFTGSTLYQINLVMKGPFTLTDTDTETDTENVTVNDNILYR